MNDRELDRLVAGANPFGDDSVRHLPTDRAESELLEEILTTTEPATRLRPSRRRRIALGAAAAVAIAAAVAVVGSVLPKDSPVAPFVAPQPAYAAELRAIAEANERILIDDPAWKISEVTELTKDSGDLEFANGDKTFELTWYPAKQYKSRFDGWAHDAISRTEVQVLGQKGTLFRHAAPPPGGPTPATEVGSNGEQHYRPIIFMLPPKGATYVQFRADLGSEEAYREILGKLKKVDVNTWLGAMPESVVKPEKLRAAVDGMLAQVTVPKGFNKAPLYKETVIGRYQLGARVTAAASCAWLDQWAAATKSGDKAKAAEAVKAMQGSKSWKILHEMKAEGWFHESVWSYADEIAGKVKPGSKTGKPAYGYEEGLDCKRFR
ncbi:hypothetical protein ACFCV3_19665 [Kribbella sp. NPDC056345]|uniref:hypothetical protein n=1 Tax=Kribbella sp. NPDC056345 TaxID=3345789 RepID=UPI0035DE6464